MCYQKSIEKYRKNLVEMVKSIFKETDNKLELKLEDCNLLGDKDSCIASSTVIGYAIEEYLTTKLIKRTTNGTPFCYQRPGGQTNQSSYDGWFDYCYENKKIRFLVNIKAEKKRSSNCAIAAIKNLYKDYCEKDPETEKSYIVLKVKYDINRDKIVISNDIEAYSLEEIKFWTPLIIKGNEQDKGGYMQDNRGWSEKKKDFNNGRLKVTKEFRKKHKVENDKISYEKTKEMIIEILEYNEERNKKFSSTDENI